MTNPINFSAFLMLFFLISCSPKEATNTTTEVTTETTIALPTVEELQKNDDVIWMAELKLDYAPNYVKWDATDEEKESMKKIGFHQMNRFKTLKHQVADLDEWENEDHFLINRILKNRANSTFYKDDALTEAYSTAEVTKMISSVDTFVVTNPVTSASQKMVIVNDLNPDDVKSFRVKQVVYYNKKDMLFYAIPQAIAPLLAEMNDDGTLTGNVEELFWMPITASAKAADLNESTLTWAKRLYRNFEVKQAKRIKGDLEFGAVIDIMMDDFRANSDNVVVHHTFDGDGTMKMEPNEIKNIGTSIDTIFTFDPKTMAETKEVRTVQLDGSTIHQLRLIQDWYWDEKTASLSMYYVGFAPIIHRYDNKGYFLNSGPVWIRRADQK